MQFLLEHSKNCEHDAIKQRVQEFSEKFDGLVEMEADYVSKMEASVPLWVQFNDHKKLLTQWLAGAEDTYNDRLQSGDAELTRASLINAQVGAAQENSTASHSCSSSFCLLDVTSFFLLLLLSS